MTTTQPAQPGRRRLIQAGVATTGAAYVAPQILKTAIAGANTRVYVSFKIESSGVDAVNGRDPSCGPGFNDALVAAGPTGTTGTTDASVVSIDKGGVGYEGAAITAGPGCELLFVGFKAGRGCYWPGSGTKEGDDAEAYVTISDDKRTATIKSPDHNISHMTFVVCCLGSPRQI
jgi:hypothetical protein